MDTIADALTRVRNAQAVGKEFVLISYSKPVLEISKILVKSGFLSQLKKVKREGKKYIKVYLKYTEGKGAIEGIKKISCPGRRFYKKAKEIKKVRSGFGISIISTSGGIMTGKEARSKNLGGEMICEVW